MKNAGTLANVKFKEQISHGIFELSVRCVLSQALEKQSRRKRGDEVFYVLTGVRPHQLKKAGTRNHKQKKG